MKMKIKQTWNKISFESEFPQNKSFSYSNVAAIYVNGNGGNKIYFGFRNESHEVETRLQSYDGYNVLTLKGDTIHAIYFNNRDNPNPEYKGGNKGSFQLVRQQPIKMSRKCKKMSTN